MKIYTSNFLSIEKEEDRLVQKWSKTSLTTENFKQELLQYLSFYKKIKPNQVIWDNHDFNLNIPTELFSWIENEILQVQEKMGLENLGFVVSKDELAQFSVIQSVNGLKNKLQPNYFTHQKRSY